MPIWIIIVVVAQFLNAFVALIDKHIIASGKISKPVVYAFYVSVLSAVSILVFVLGFLPFDFGEIQLPNILNISWPTLQLAGMSLIAGYGFFFALVTSYKAFQRADASDIIPVVGSVNAIATFLLSFIFLGEVLTNNFLYGFILLVVGMIILSHFRFTWKVFLYSFSSGVFFAIYFAAMKYMFNVYAFDQAFFWTRIGMVVVAFSVFMIPKLRRDIKAGSQKSGVNGGLWVLGNNILGGIAGIALLKATELGSVTIVQALNGLQFAFLIIISALFGKITSETFGENNTMTDIIQKAVSVTLIIIGFYLLFI